jgi:hypothetical protein
VFQLRGRNRTHSLSSLATTRHFGIEVNAFALWS